MYYLLAQAPVVCTMNPAAHDVHVAVPLVVAAPVAVRQLLGKAVSIKHFRIHFQVTELSELPILHNSDTIGLLGEISVVGYLIGSSNFRRNSMFLLPMVSAHAYRMNSTILIHNEVSYMGHSTLTTMQ